MIVIITGPTCSGKSSLVAELKNRGFLQIVTTTTRPQRPTDKPSDYNFINEDEFMYEMEKNRLLESNQHGDYLYGVGLQEVVKAVDCGGDWVITLDPSGQRKLKRYLEANKAPMLSVFLQADAKVRLHRLVQREGKHDAVMDRLATMLTVEAHWFRDDSEYYDMLLETGENSAKDVADVITQHVTRYNKNSLSKKVS